MKVSQVKWDVQSLFRRHAQEIDRFLRRRGHAPDVAADITQDTFLRVLSIRSETCPSNPRAYIHQIARNLSLDLYRKERRVELVVLTEEALHAIADPAPGPERSVIGKERLSVVEHAISGLPDRTRQAFEFYQVGDRTIAEVAVLVGLSTSRTATLIRQAYCQLKQALDDAST